MRLQRKVSTSVEGKFFERRIIYKLAINSYKMCIRDSVIGIVSGKGGVGKSLVTSLLACAMNKKGYKTAILDADITGPSIPQAFGIKEKAKSDELGIWPVTTDQGIKVMSINLLLDNITDAVIWRGPMTVSYTHLDVYKRQCLCSAFAGAATGWNL